MATSSVEWPRSVKDSVGVRGVPGLGPYSVTPSMASQRAPERAEQSLTARVKRSEGGPQRFAARLVTVPARQRARKSTAAAAPTMPS